MVNIRTRRRRPPPPAAAVIVVIRHCRFANPQFTDINHPNEGKERSVNARRMSRSRHLSMATGEVRPGPAVDDGLFVVMAAADAPVGHCCPAPRYASFLATAAARKNFASRPRGVFSPRPGHLSSLCSHLSASQTSFFNLPRELPFGDGDDPCDSTHGLAVVSRKRMIHFHFGELIDRPISDDGESRVTAA